MNTEINNITGVSRHAVTRFIERDKNGLIKSIENNIIAQAKTATEIFPINPVEKLFKNNYKSVRYFKKKNIVFVVTNDGKILTVIRFNPSEFYTKNKILK